MATRKKLIHVTPRHPAVDIGVLGNRDPRGLDNTVSIWLDDQDKLHIRVLKADRCYKFSCVEECPAFIELIQE